MVADAHVTDTFDCDDVVSGLERFGLIESGSRMEAGRLRHVARLSVPCEGVISGYGPEIPNMRSRACPTRSYVRMGYGQYGLGSRVL